MTLFTASITFNLVILLLISEFKMETIHYAPRKKRLIVFFCDEELHVTAVTHEKETETVVEGAEINVKAIGSMIYDEYESLRRRSQAMEIDAAGNL